LRVTIIIYDQFLRIFHASDRRSWSQTMRSAALTVRKCPPRRIPSSLRRSIRILNTSPSISNIHGIVPFIADHRRCYDQRGSRLLVVTVHVLLGQRIIRIVVPSSTNPPARYDRSMFLMDTCQGPKHWRCRQICAWKVITNFSRNTGMPIAQSTIARAAVNLGRSIAIRPTAIQAHREGGRITGCLIIMLANATRLSPRIWMHFACWIRDSTRTTLLASHHPPAEGEFKATCLYLKEADKEKSL